jgi:hypothetical protein
MDDEVETGPVPNNDEGWGRIDLTEIIGSDRVYDFVDQSVPLSTGQQFERRIVIADSSEPLKVTLAYTDVPGFPGAVPALVNNLDLEVVAPDGRIYHGNEFDNGGSVPDTLGYDNLNNVEAVHIFEPLPGEYVLRVIARNVPEDARLDTGAVDQDFALVASGLIPPPGFGIVLLDRPAYTAPSAIKIKVIDSNLGTQPSTTATIKSTTEPNGFSVTLQYAGISGSFTGTVLTAAGAAVPGDGKLQIAHGDSISVEYFDVSAGVTRIANAGADLIPPIISGVAQSSQYGQALITWTTDEPANSVVRFNTNTTLSRVITNNALVTAHVVELTNLIPGRTYFYAVSSTDVAGNSSSNDNDGALYSFVGPTNAPVLLVNAYTPSGEGEFIPLSAYTNALSAAGISFDVLNVSPTSGTQPPLSRLLPYSVVMWRINDAYDVGDSLSAFQQGVVKQYVTNGGSFFMASMEVISRLLNGGGAAFVTNVFHVSRFTPNDPFNPCPTCDEDHTVPTAEGINQDPLSAGLVLDLDYSHYPEIDILGLGPDFADTFGVKGDASRVFLESSSGEPCGMKYPRAGQDSTGRVVFFSFPLDSIPESGPAGNLRATVLRRVMQFLIPGLDGIGTIALDREKYTIPDLVTIEVADADLIGRGNITVECHSDSVPGPVAMTLNATARAGVFRGTASLTNTAGPPAPGRLRANNGDNIYALYVDASGGVTISAQAQVDTVPPVISNLAASPDYEAATITWETDEFTDATVQFGESPFLGRTAFGEELGDVHELQLIGLVPDQLYYYRVVSRDAAGNTTVDDNNGALYTFRTLVPRLPPVSDNFDSGANDWTLFNGDDTQTEWTLGVPNNGVETAAHSPPNAWGSCLNGANADTIDTFLISPAISLVGGNSATLTFWHSYDFLFSGDFDIINGGELLLITNGNAAPVTLAVYEDDFTTWTQEQFDLTPYIGHVVYLVFHHQLFSFESAERGGWLVDDVSITTTSITPGTLRVTNNLSQAAFTVAGPVNVSGQGNLLLMTNAAPGQYVVTWQPVLDWNTPPPQTNSVAALGTTVFTGTYTITDTNNNGMADSWERTYFGAATASHAALTDTDGDGMSDYAEFLAGTNPTNAASYLHFLTPAVQNTGAVRFDWPSVPGKSYRLSGSGDLDSWNAATDWIRANGTVLSFTTNAISGTRFYRLEVRP